MVVFGLGRVVCERQSSGGAVSIVQYFKLYILFVSGLHGIYELRCISSNMSLSANFEFILNLDCLYRKVHDFVLDC